MRLTKIRSLLKTPITGFGILAISLFSCQGDFTPKPKGYNRIDLPEHAYQPLNEPHPYFFEYSKYAKVLDDTSYIAEPHWIDLYYPEFRSNIQITYKNVRDDKKEFDKLINDAHKLTSKHNIKAYAIDEGVIKTPNGNIATVFELQGQVPSQFQFYITDSTDHFLRGAVYFRTATKNDSLAPIIEFMKRDVMHMLNTLKWVDKEKK
ncbi:MAG TPA: gliding motility lipoprotein GldD [Cytophagaceae bacterium]